MPEGDMNMKLRTDVLQQSLEIESSLSQWLVIHFGLSESNLKTLGHKSSALSFRNKIDLLYDLNQLNKVTYDNLILFMEIRNQLIHNAVVNTLEKALYNIGKKTKLMQFIASSDVAVSTIIKDEEKLILAEYALVINIMQDLSQGMRRTAEEAKDRLDKMVRFSLMERVVPILLASIEEFATDMKDTCSEEGWHDSELDKIIPLGIMAIFRRRLDEEL